MELALPIILGIINGSFALLANHLGKPAGWVPSPQEWADLQAHVDASTPESVKAEARARLLASGVTLPALAESPVVPVVSPTIPT